MKACNDDTKLEWMESDASKENPDLAMPYASIVTPGCKKLWRDGGRPRCKKSGVDNEDLRQLMPDTDRTKPNRQKTLNGRALSGWTKSSKGNGKSSQDIPYATINDPKWARLRDDKELPEHEKFKTAIGGSGCAMPYGGIVESR